MSLKYLARHAFSLSWRIALAKSVAYVGRILKSNIRQVTERKSSSYQKTGEEELSGCLNGLEIVALSNELPALSRKVLDHRFNLLGSGWVKVEHTPHIEHISFGNRARSAAIRQLIGPEYKPIDWQLDLKSGSRWREDCISGTLRYGHEPGVDVKVPWEMARLQHLPWLAIVGEGGSVGEFRNQVLDFAAANPPGYGVNWMCTMDVAIRAANILIAYDILVAEGAEFDEQFLGEFHALILAHGIHIAGNIEWHDLHRANHYLADIAGLLFVAAYLPRSAETDAWLAFSIQQLIKEVERQFTLDGGNFEASTSYHRLSAEMVVYATSLVLGLPEDKKAALSNFDHKYWKVHPPLDPGPIEMFPISGSNELSPFPNWYFERLERMAEFTMHVTKPNGHIAQIGDNDSGRFLKICPSMIEVDGEPSEQHLDHRATVAAINGLFRRRDFSDFAAADFALETTFISTLAKGQRLESYLKDRKRPDAEGKEVDERGVAEDKLTAFAETIIELPDDAVLDGLSTFAYPDFGLFIWRSLRFFLSVRCGPVGQNGNGGHAHNDQLAIELNIDGEDWIADPGTYLYTPSPKDRDAYRSVHAHAAPKIGKGEPARLDLGLFRLEDKANARCLRFDIGGFEGMHVGYREPLHRRIELENSRIRITDLTTGKNRDEVNIVTVCDGKSLREYWSLNLPFSPGYGLQD